MDRVKYIRMLTFNFNDRKVMSDYARSIWIVETWEKGELLNTESHNEMIPVEEAKKLLNEFSCEGGE